MRRVLTFLLVALVVAGAALGANLLLLGTTGGGAVDRVGTLSPVQPALTVRTSTSTPTTTSTPPTTTSGDDHHGGRGRDHPQDD